MMFNPDIYGETLLDDQAQKKKSIELLHSKIRMGKEDQEVLLRRCAENVPRDRYVRPSNMVFTYLPDKDKHVTLRYLPNEVVKIHRNALGQIADTIGLPRNYVHKLHTAEDWRESLLAYNINELFTQQEFKNRLKQPAEFLHRLVGDELRGFLTQSYNRHLLSMPMLNAFIEACNEVWAEPVAGYASDTRVGLQCYLPWAFEPVPGEFVAIGVWFGNSDFGDGRLRVSHTMMRVNCWGSAIMEDSYSRVHLGGVVRDSDIRLSDAVAAKEIDTVALAIKDSVHQILSPDPVRKLMKLIKLASEEELDWSRLKGQLGKLLSKENVDKLKEYLDTPIRDLPPPGVGENGKPLATRWWASSAVSYLAEHEPDKDKQSDLQQAAGKILGTTNV